jgi:hypothetical protein
LQHCASRSRNSWKRTTGYRSYTGTSRRPATITKATWAGRSPNGCSTAGKGHCRYRASSSRPASRRRCTITWGLVGLCQGSQHERFYRRIDAGENDTGQAELESIGTQEAGPGDFYELIPPENDVHSVTTTSEVPSVSIHLLGADVGCIPRHSFDLDADLVRQFQSGYTNVECETPEAIAHDHGHE